MLLEFPDFNVEVTPKKIKNIHLRVYPPDGHVRVSAPRRMSADAVRAFVTSKLDWITKQQQKLRSQKWEAPKEYVDQESHYVDGRQCLLKIIEHKAPAKVALNNDALELYIRPGTPTAKRQKLVDDWYRAQLKERIPGIIERYEVLMGVEVAEFGVKKMKTRWGTCNMRARRIWLNLELAKKPQHCLEYVVVHEMVHLLEASHNQRFKSLMDKYLPMWKTRKEELNMIKKATKAAF